MPIIRIRKAAVYLSKNTPQDKPIANLFNAILEIDKQTNKNKFVGFNADKGNQTLTTHTGKNLEQVEIADTDEGRNFMLSNAEIDFDLRSNCLTITAEKANEV